MQKTATNNVELAKPSQKLTGFRKLIIYQKAKRFVIDIYQATGKYPKNETYSVVSQMRRCSVSIVANIVEGYSKSSTKDFIRFLDISVGSANELDFFLELSLDLKYVDNITYKELENKLVEIKKLLYSFQKSLRKRVI